MTNIPKWKFDALREAIFAVLRRGDIPFADLKDAVRAELSEEVLARLGSLGWHTTCVKLELEVRGEVERIAGKTPQMLRLSPT